MQFRVLGQVEAIAGGRSLVFARRQERCLLGLLLLEAGRIVSTDRLVELLWEGEDPPVRARRTLHTHVARVRSALAGAATDGNVQLVTHGSGYVLHVDPDTVDVHRFQRLVTEAGAQPPAARADLLAAALTLWRGPVLGDDASEQLQERVGAGLAAARLAALELWLDALVATGRHDEALPPLTQLTIDHPARERFTELHMTALYRAGRKAEALSAFERTRAWLADNLGIDPTPPLRELHRMILRDEMAGPPAAAAAPPAAGDLPAQLPADMAGFVGRDADLAALSGLLAPGGASPTAVVIAVVAGTAGVGKTALAVHFGHRVADRFPDGQLYLNLRGHAQGSPMTPVEAVTRLLGSLGVPAKQIPVHEEAAAGLYRSKLAGKRMLILLDDAGSAQQVRPLLPASPGCLALVTSRDRLTGLVASHGARRRVLDTLRADDAHTLLAGVVGADRVAAEPAAAAELARLCAFLPLALRMAAANLASRPQWTIAEYVAALRADRLGLLEVDGDAAVEAAFGLSYARLPEPARRMFRLLGRAPGVAVTVAAAAALADVEVPEATALLDQLAAAHLIEEHRPHRYACHDLLRLHARTRAEEEDDEPTRHAAADRLYSWCLATTAHAAQLAYPQIVCLPTTRAWAARAATRFAAPGDAAGWLDAERANLTATIVATAAHGPGHIAWLLADALRGYFNMRMHLADWLVCANAAAHAARAATDTPGQAAAQISIAQSDRRRSRLPQAVAGYQAALPLCERADWPEGEATAHNNLGTTYLERGELKQGRDHLRIAAGVYGRIGDMDGEATATSNLGVVSMLLGELRDAETFLLRAAAIRGAVRTGGLVFATENLGDVCRLLGKYDEALRHAEEALAVQRTVGNPVSISIIGSSIAQIHRDAGRVDAALEPARAALDLGVRCASPRAEADARNTVGSLHTLRGEFDEAVAEHRRALHTSREATVRYPETNSLLGLAAAHLGRGELADALACAQDALVLARVGEYRLLEGNALIALGRVAAARGEPAAAREYAREALAIHRGAGHPLGVTRALAVLEG